MLTQQQIDIIINVMKPYNPKKIGIFGSYARGENTEGSDIDILYNFGIESNMTFFTMSKLYEELENKLHSKVDLVPERSIYPAIKEQILNDLKVIYERA